MALLEKKNRQCSKCGEALSRLWSEEICPKCKNEIDEYKNQEEEKKKLNYKR